MFRHSYKTMVNKTAVVVITVLFGLLFIAIKGVVAENVNEERRYSIKKIEAIIRTEKLDSIKEALKALGVSGMAVIEVKSHGSQIGVGRKWWGKKYSIDLIPKIKLEIVVNDDDVDEVVQAILEECRTGSIGDGKIFVSEILNVYRIRTGEEGKNVL